MAHHPLPKTCTITKFIAQVQSEQMEGLDDSTSKLKEYARVGHPYMRGYCISSEISNQFIMSPFMSKIMAAADFYKQMSHMAK